MQSDKFWVDSKVNLEEAKKIAKSAGISDFLSKIFISREINDVNYIKTFLNPTLSKLYDPYLLKDMERAVNRIIQAIKSHEKILVFGDYDVDGITSTSILYDFLSNAGAEVDYYIPNRINDGYGLSIVAIDKVLEKDPKLIITVDCGITSIEEIEYLKKKQVDVIITDHHECKGDIPKACAVVNPCRSDCTYPFDKLAGVGVAYKLLCALSEKLGYGDAHLKYLDLVAIGTVADVVSLVDENRIIVSYGLNGVEKSTNVGLKALLNETNLVGKPITSWSVGFVIAPRINAAGRIGDAGKAVRLFTTKDEIEARNIVLELIEENKYRQETEMGIYKEVVDAIESNPRYKTEKVIVVSGENWHSGIIGIVASKICDKYYKPCVLINNENGMGKGSARSIKGFNIFSALSHCESILVKYGGHELAAGLSIDMKNIEDFVKKINDYAEQVLTEEDMIPKVSIDLELDIKDISMENIKEMEKMAPFGVGNNIPLFLCKGLDVKDVKTVGGDKHLKLILGRGSFFADAIGFNMGGKLDRFKAEATIDVVCFLELNIWNGIEKLQLNIKDFRGNRLDFLENKYYESVENTFCFTKQDCRCNEKEKIEGSKELKVDCSDLKSFLINSTNKRLKTVVVVNSINDLKEFSRAFQSNIELYKKPYSVHFEKIIEEGELLNVVVNPHHEKNDFSTFERVLFYGSWINQKYLFDLIAKTKSKEIFHCINIDQSFRVQDIVPERNDLAAVYKYIKLNVENTLEIKDLSSFSKKIADYYKIYMNCFKVKKIFEVFDELKLIKAENNGSRGMKVTMFKDEGSKKDLENSTIYRNLQALKN